MSDESPARRLLGPFNRVEGDLEVRIEVEGDCVSRAWVNSPLFRGFEQILHGKDPRDALVYTPRICGICSVSQSVAAASALAAAQQLEPAPNGSLAANLILAAENLADHLSHFYLFFMPDFARDCYREHDWFEAVHTRFRAQSGDVGAQVLPARAAFLHLTGILAGKWPHSLAIQPGGTTRPIEIQERIRASTIISVFRAFLQDVVFGAELEQVAELADQQAMWQLVEDRPDADFSRFIRIARDLELDELGRASDNFMSYGAYRQSEGHLFAAGTWQKQFVALDADTISEDTAHSWLSASPVPKHPYHGSTIPDSDESSGYSWCKAPRLDSRVMEVGALARQVVNGQPLIRDLVAKSGGNVQNRVIARLLELALVVPIMEQWINRLKIGDPYCTHADMPEEGRGAGMVEAARGSLGHWLRIKNGRILNYQIVAPTTWNFSPADSAGQPGALEQALLGTSIVDEKLDAARIQHIIRSFDPCMVCTVH